MHDKKTAYLKQKIQNQRYDAKSLLEIHALEAKGRKQDFEKVLQMEQDSALRQKLARLADERLRWFQAKPTKDRRRQQREFERLAEVVWNNIPEDSYIEFRELAESVGVSTRNLFRILPMWLKHGLIEMQDRNRQTLSKHAKSFDIRRRGSVLVPLVYSVPKEDVHRFNADWQSKVAGG